MRQKDREEFIAIMAAEGISVDVSRKLLAAGATLHRLAELECSSEAADRDRVWCPNRFKKPEAPTCLCRDYGAYDEENARALEQPGPRHGKIPRIAVRGDRLQRRIEKLCAANKLEAIFGGDPRGAVLLVKVPSGRTNDWGQRGIVAG